MKTGQSAGALSVARESLWTGQNFLLYFPDVRPVILVINSEPRLMMLSMINTLN